jgi:hypothetical protein
MAVELRALGKFWGELSDDGRYLELRRHDCRVARVDLVESARAGRTVLCDPGRVRVRSEGDEGAGVSGETGLGR